MFIDRGKGTAQDRDAVRRPNETSQKLNVVSRGSVGSTQEGRNVLRLIARQA